MPLAQALESLLTAAEATLPPEPVTTMDADGRVLAQDVVSALQVPAWDNSAMDGYAVRCAEVSEPGAVLPVLQRIAAGEAGKALQALTAARIFTGAPVPAGADAVVMQEDCTVVNACEGGVRINVAPTPGQNIRRAGEDVRKDAVVLQKGERITPAVQGLVASLGLNSVLVARRARVALFSTGDELVMPGDVAPQDMRPGAIYNSNRFFLASLLRRMGCEVSDFGIVPDNREATVSALRDAAQGHDVILTSGGVSVGEEDHIKPAVQQLGSLDLWQIAIKPGKPFAYGLVNRTDGSPCHFLGLPGNPVSSFVTFLVLVRPFLLRLQGQRDVAMKKVAVRADFAWAKADNRQEFLRVRRNSNGGLDLFPNQSSGVLTSTVWGDGVVDNPGGRTIAVGDMVEFIAFSDLLA
ncbi:molybdopterin molybdotransferase MoeA [Curvibacter sp. APW13]|nr:gephyrin-like molybdotransferase Glp [Curvibacter sp. APW13]MDT8992127.1 molybdopterin molybdotransferase MoeA [Curvibacter sp. APW13]